MIKITHLVKKYGDHYAVKDLSFEVEEGQIYGFLGPNGAGKSTTMNIITGYLAATKGEVLINGHDILKEPEEAKKNIGYLPELPPLYQEMTVEEYLKFAAELKKIPKNERKEAINEAMEMAKVVDVRNRLIRNLSKGYKQRVGLAQAVLGNPPIIILDEPTVGLDPKQMIEMRDLIRGLKEKHTVILSSHILSEVSAVCNQIMIISKGQLVACDTPEGLADKMQGEEELTFIVKGSKEALDEVLNSLEEITSFETEEKADNEVLAVAHVKQGLDIREELFYALAEKKLPLYQMNKTTQSLEEIFLQLTTGSAENEEVAEDDSNL